MRIRWVRMILATITIYGLGFMLIVAAFSFSILFTMSDDPHPTAIWIPVLIDFAMIAVVFILGRWILPKQPDTPLVFEWSVVAIGIVVIHYAIFFEQVLNGAVLNDLARLIGMSLTASLIGILGSLSKQIKTHRFYINQR